MWISEAIKSIDIDIIVEIGKTHTKAVDQISNISGLPRKHCWCYMKRCKTRFDVCMHGEQENTARLNDFV